MNPDNLQTYANLADALAETNKIEEAMEFYQKAIELDPRNEVPYNNLIINLKHLSHMQKALAFF